MWPFWTENIRKHFEAEIQHEEQYVIVAVHHGYFKKTII